MRLELEQLYIMQPFSQKGMDTARLPCVAANLRSLFLLSESFLQRQQIRSLLRRSYCHRPLRRRSCACTSSTRPSSKWPPEHGRSGVMGRYLVQKLHHARAEGSEEARRAANLRQPQHQVTCRVCRPAVQLPERCAPKFSYHYPTLFLPRCVCQSCS